MTKVQITNFFSYGEIHVTQLAVFPILKRAALWPEVRPCAWAAIATTTFSCGPTEAQTLQHQPPMLLSHLPLHDYFVNVKHEKHLRGPPSQCDAPHGPP